MGVGANILLLGDIAANGFVVADVLVGVCCAWRVDVNGSDAAGVVVVSSGALGANDDWAAGNNVPAVGGAVAMLSPCPSC